MEILFDGWFVSSVSAMVILILFLRFSYVHFLMRFLRYCDGYNHLSHNLPVLYVYPLFMMCTLQVNETTIQSTS